MATSETRRKLTAILSADVAGYSRLMGADEETTIEMLTAYRKVFTSQIKKYRGRVVDAKGDAILAEFASVVDAVNGAVEIQRELAEKNAELSDDRRMDFRIGINLGDVVVKDDVIYGDGVNIAARVESLAEGGGICISGRVYDQVENKLPFHYGFLGEKNVKNIARPVRVYQLLSKPGAAAGRVAAAKKAVSGRWRKAIWAVAAAMILMVGVLLAWNYWQPAPEPLEGALALPDKPSIAVLAFNNLSGDKEQEYFSDGISENIITDLSKLSGLFVIARNSSFTYKGKPVKIQQVGRELGVRYVLEGSVQKGGDRVRVSAQLIEAASGKHIWAERYDRRLKDIFALQDELTEKIVGALEVELTMDEVTRIRRKSTENLVAWDHYLQALELYRRFTSSANDHARDNFKKALELDPDFEAAWLGLAWTQLLDGRWWHPGDISALDDAAEIAKLVISRDGTLAEPYALLGKVFLVKGKYDQAIYYGNRAVALNPNGADWHFSLAGTLGKSGKLEEAMAELNKALRLSPSLPKYFQYSVGEIYYLTAQYEKAINIFRSLIERDPKPHGRNFLLVASYAASGRLEEAKSAVAEFRKIRAYSMSPKVWVHNYSEFKNQAERDRLLADLAKAGLQ